MNDQPNREEDIFDSALQLPAAERAAYVDRACAGDATLRQRVEILLAAHHLTTNVLDRPPVASARTVVMSASPTQLTEQPGQQIGRYKLREKIGEGGCGVVYVADQAEPVRRRVALKVIKLGMDTRQVVARFEAERQVLALMDHPNIAKVLDGGATEAGRPYFVMELVRGIKITDYCDQNNLSTEERLKLFIQVCKAVQHAHQKGIIHRDIKPSNILVTLHDGVPVPKVIDFGIAKATGEQRLTDKTIYTAFEQFMGTPAYMSPEQAEMSGLDIDTRSDIYSLGVLLYELLTGRTPFDPHTLMESGIDQMRRIIREQEPARPSTCLSTLTQADLTQVASHRRADPPKLRHAIEGDLDWIVMKLLEKDRTRRYETATGVAADIQRHLDNEPVTARPPSSIYRFQRILRRNRMVVNCFLFVFLFTLFISVGDGIRKYRQSEQERRVLEKARNDERLARKQAEDAAKKANEVLAYFRNMFMTAGSGYADKVTVVQMLDWSTRDVKAKFRDEPDVSAAVQYSIGYCYSRIGRWDDARKYLREALSLQEQLYGDEDGNTLDTMLELSSVELSQGQTNESKMLCEKILASADSAISKHPEQRSNLIIFDIFGKRKLIQIYLEEQNTAQARPLVEDLIAAIKSGEVTGQQAAFVWEGSGDIARLQGRPQDALAAYEKAQPLIVPTALVQNAWLHSSQGAAYLALGDYARAEPLLTNELPILQKRFGDTHFRVQHAYQDLVQLYTATGRTNEAAQYRAKLIAPKSDFKTQPK